jgi:hypothetical protein
MVPSCEQNTNVLEDANGTAARRPQIIVDTFAFMLVITLFAAACLFIYINSSWLFLLQNLGIMSFILVGTRLAVSALGNGVEGASAAGVDAEVHVVIWKELGVGGGCSMSVY